MLARTYQQLAARVAVHLRFITCDVAGHAEQRPMAQFGGPFAPVGSLPAHSVGTCVAPGRSLAICR